MTHSGETDSGALRPVLRRGTILGGANRENQPALRPWQARDSHNQGEVREADARCTQPSPQLFGPLS